MSNETILCEVLGFLIGLVGGEGRSFGGKVGDALSRPTKQVDDFFRMLAQTYPHGAYEMDPDAFMVCVAETNPYLWREDVERLLKQTEDSTP